MLWSAANEENVSQTMNVQLIKLASIILAKILVLAMSVQLLLYVNQGTISPSALALTVPEEMLFPGVIQSLELVHLAPTTD